MQNKEKNIQTHKADVNLVRKFLDYANCADASYAMLHWVNYIKKDDNDKNEEGDTQTIGHQFNNQNSTYARAIEARFNQDKIISKEGSLCVTLVDLCLGSKDIKIDNDISKVGLNDTLSQRTIDFVNRYRLLKHQPNTSSGFSGTLFEDTKDNNQKIFVIRGTEFPSGTRNDVLDADLDLTLGQLPLNQYLDMLKFYSECVKEIPSINPNLKDF